MTVDAKGKTHRRAGTLTAGDLLASWVDHDLLHARQMVRILHRLAQADGAPHSTRYAGEW